MIGHLGPRVSALLDGQLSPEETERAWAHVHGCHACRDQVEREGWVKTRLAGLSLGEPSVPEHLKCRIGSSALAGPVFPIAAAPSRPRRQLGLVALGGGAVGLAVAGVLVLGTAPADGPAERRAPVTNLSGQGESAPARTLVPPTQLRREPGR